MKKSIAIIGSIFCAVNILFGVILTAFDTLNVVASTIVIILSTLLLSFTNGNIRLNDGYKVSLNFIIPTIALILYFLSVFMPNRLTDNWCLIAIIILTFFESILLIAANRISTKIQ